MKLFVQVLDPEAGNGCRYQEQIEVDDELFYSPDAKSRNDITLQGVKTALDYYLVRQTQQKPSKT